MTFPRVLDIFWPSASRTRVWMYTSRNGHLAHHAQAEHDHPRHPEEQDVVAR